MIQPDSNQGLYSVDTRFVSFYQLYINRMPLKVVNSSQLTFYASRFHLTNPRIKTEGGELKAHTLGLTINRMVGDNLHEDIEVCNYAGRKVHFLLELTIRSDFADIFEVKSHSIVQRGQTETEWHRHQKKLYTVYDNKGFHRAITYQISGCDTPLGYANGRIFFEIELNQNESWQFGGDLLLEHGQHGQKSIFSLPNLMHLGEGGRTPSPKEQPTSDFDERQARWQARCTDLATPDHMLYQAYQQAVLDMGALRIYDMDVSEDAWVPAAGVPWFVTLFGRDSLTVSYQNMMISPDFARGALKRLAEYQAQERDDWRDAQPGKIMHELRSGELAHFHSIPFYPYYGTADATIWYLIVLSETYRWTGDVSLLQEYREVAEGCLQWIDHSGDLDGDGFQEYKTFSTPGYENLGWKDASDAVVYADGSQVKQPKGTCELQGYVYDAKLRMAEVFEALGDEGKARALRAQAEELKRKFNQVYWMEDEGCYAYALGPQKELVTSIASNPGQCLWSGIADQEKAERTARRLLQEDMFSGWGIRTLSSKNPAYNPYAYQLGSVWPHDNGIIAAGFKRYGLVDEANQVIRAMFDAIEHFDSYRPPEVFAGLHRKGKIDFPALYPGGANIPQAWATGSIFHMVQTMLGIRADVPHKRLFVHPTLPEWLPEVTLKHMKVGPCTVSLHFWREGDISRWEVTALLNDKGTAPEDQIQVVQQECERGKPNDQQQMP
jgi:glycogen debranching enzyme